MNITKRKVKHVRVDADVWNNARIALPRCTDPEISRVLYNTSAVKAERYLIGDVNKNIKTKLKKTRVQR